MLYYYFAYQEVNDFVLVFNSFSTTLLFTLICSNVNLNLIKERCDNFKNIVNIKEILGVVFTQIFLSMALAYLSIAFLANSDKTKTLDVLNDNFMNPTNNSKFVLLVIYSVILAPILEEIVFKRLSIRFSFIISAVISSLVFCFGHEFLRLLGTIVFGISACILYVKYNNILIPMAVHFINNLLATLLEPPSYLNVSMNESVDVITNFDIKIWFTLGLALTIITSVIFIRFIVRNKSYIQRNK